MQGNYDDTITYLERWESSKYRPVPIKNKSDKGSGVLPKNKQYDEAAMWISEAVADHEAEGMILDEGANSSTCYFLRTQAASKG